MPGFTEPICTMETPSKKNSMAGSDPPGDGSDAHKKYRN